MMRLAIETATDRASVAIGTSSADAVELGIVGARRHAAELLPAIDALLRDAGIGLAAITGLAVSDGPGSFTGLRVGATVAKALARARDLPVWAAPSLLVRASGVGRPGETVVAVANALRGDLYAAAFGFHVDRIEALLPPSVYRPEDLMGRGLRPTRLVGEAPPTLVHRLEEGFAQGLIAPPVGAPHARALLGLIDRLGGAVRLEHVESWEPSYGRPAEAQARWETAHGRPLPDSIGSRG